VSTQATCGMFSSHVCWGILLLCECTAIISHHSLSCTPAGKSFKSVPVLIYIDCSFFPVQNWLYHIDRECRLFTSICIQIHIEIHNFVRYSI
jgi:hypothetical protein